MKKDMRRKAVADWINEKITTGKMMEVCGVKGIAVNDLCGLMANEYGERHRAFLASLVAKRLKCEQLAEEAKAERKFNDAATELAKVNVYLSLEYQVKQLFNL